MAFKLIQGDGNVPPLSPEARRSRAGGMIFGSWVMQQLRTGNKLERYASTLQELFEINGDREAGVLLLRVRYGHVVVTMRVGFCDEQSKADMVVLTMTTLFEEPGKAPVPYTGRGFGSKALQDLLSWAARQGLNHIEAVQVQKQAERFWVKNGFYALNTVCNDYRFGKHPST